MEDYTTFITPNNFEYLRNVKIKAIEIDKYFTELTADERTTNEQLLEEYVFFIKLVEKSVPMPISYAKLVKKTRTIEENIEFCKNTLSMLLVLSNGLTMHKGYEVVSQNFIIQTKDSFIETNDRVQDILHRLETFHWEV